MRYALDTEFIDTPEASELISIALVDEAGESVYFEFDVPDTLLTPWLIENVVPHLKGDKTTFTDAREEILAFVKDGPEIFAIHGAYDWYWLCRLFGGFINLPKGWPEMYTETMGFIHEVPGNFGPQHNALNDAQALMAAIKEAE